MSQQLDRGKPLWEMWIIEGLSEGRWGLITKLHHCMVDGVSGTELMAVILDSERDPKLRAPDDWHPERQPLGAELAAQRLPGGRSARMSSCVPSGPRRARRAVWPRTPPPTARGLWTMAGLASPPPPSSLNGSQSPTALGVGPSTVVGRQARPRRLRRHR